MKRPTDLPLIPVPFAPGEVRDANRRRRAPNNHIGECLFCDRPLSPSAITCFVEMTTNGDVVPVGQSVTNSQGCFPVGSTCKNLVPKEYRMTKRSNPELWESLK